MRARPWRRCSREGCSRRQRKRHCGDGRDPLRRQRPPLSPCRQHDERRLPGAAVRRRRPLHRAARKQRRCKAHRPRCARSRPRSRPWPATLAPSCRAAAWRTKIEAGKIAMAAGTHMVITSGKVVHPLTRFPTAAPCTWLLAPLRSGDRAQALDRRAARAQGQVVIDAGAERALTRRQEPAAGRRSRVEGAFERGDAVVIRGPKAARSAVGSSPMRATTRRASSASARLRSRRSSGFCGRDELVHRDDMALSRS